MSDTTRRAVLTGAIGLTAGAAWGRTRGITVTCAAGRFVGERDDSGVSRFLGIRYGRAARFQAPVAAPPARDLVRATTYGAVCPQRTVRGLQAEDCLSLNVWTPDPRFGAKLPVMVYIHGGGYAFGSGNDAVCDGRHLASRGVLVVTINHRLNALGYLYLARLDPRFPNSGNAGQLDLIVALQWIRANIAAFGGDAGCVTVFGDSGGGGKVTTLMAMPAATGLFQRAATMSGQQVTASGPLHATRRARAYCTRLEAPVSDLSTLAHMPVERLIEALDMDDPIAGGPIYMGPVLDRGPLPRHPFWPDAPPSSVGIPLLSGNAHDETRGFIDPESAFLQTMTWANVGERTAPELPVDAAPEWIIAEYRRHLPAASPADVYFLATTAGRSWRPQLEVAEARVRASAPTWLYQIDFASRADPRRGAFHCIDVPLLFGTLSARSAGIGDDNVTRGVSRAVQDIFVSFARAGDPGWPQYELPGRATMIVDESNSLEHDPRGWQRRLFSSYPYLQPGS